MKMLAKASCDTIQLKDRIDKGFKYIELQLLGDFLDDSIDIESISKTILNKSWDIPSIHMPLIEGGQDIDLEFFSHNIYNKAFRNVCELAQKCADFYNHKVTIIIHSAFTLRMYENIPMLLNFLISLLKEMTDKYPDITFSFENVFPVNLKKEYVSFQNNVFMENVELANYFNDVLDKKVCFTTLDVCHMMGTLKLMEAFKDERKYKKFSYVIEDFFKETSSTINNIHFNNIKKRGMDKGEHSATFYRDDEGDIIFLDYLIHLYKKYCGDALMTLEIDEVNYNNAILAKELRELINERFN